MGTIFLLHKFICYLHFKQTCDATRAQITNKTSMQMRTRACVITRKTVEGIAHHQRVVIPLFAFAPTLSTGFAWKMSGYARDPDFGTPAILGDPGHHRLYLSMGTYWGLPAMET